MKDSDEYLLVRGSFEEVQKQVNNALADGWLPLGAPFKIGHALDQQAITVSVFAQALVCGKTAERLRGMETS